MVKLTDRLLIKFHKIIAPSDSPFCWVLGPLLSKLSARTVFSLDKSFKNKIHYITLILYLNYRNNTYKAENEGRGRY